MSDPNGDKLQKRRAIEALRNGVPNRDAVKLLGCSQREAETRCDELLDRVADGGDPGDRGGMVVQGDFGAGKSHLLRHLEQHALGRGFVCSMVVISKETPLHNLHSMFSSAVDSAVAPDHQGRLIEELALATKQDSEAYGRFFGWVANEVERGRLNGIFRASLIAYETSQDVELKGKIESFWSGGRLNAAELKRGLRQIGRRDACAFKTPRLADLPPQRLRFLLEMIKGVGYQGWLVLLDEIELIGNYTPLQRGRAYAELARWLRLGKGNEYPGLICIGTVTGDYADVYISPEGRKKDFDAIGPKLRARPKLEAFAPLAEEAMGFLESDCLTLAPPSRDEEESALGVLRQLYSEAYGWDAPAARPIRNAVGLQRRMRYKVRSAINEWDLQRLAPGARPDTVVDEYRPQYLDPAQASDDILDEGGQESDVRSSPDSESFA